MKKSELTQLTQIIEHLVAKEVRKQLPSIIAETFQNMMGTKSIVTEQRNPSPTVREQIEPEVTEEPPDFKASLKDLFAGNPVMTPPKPQVRETIQFTKNPKFNQILNETVSDLVSRERLVGAAAFQGGYSPSLDMIPGFNPNAGQSAIAEPEPSFMRNMPTMPNMHTMPNLPVSRPPVLAEGQVSNHAPLEALPHGLSVLDVKNQIPDPVLKHALTRNYSELVKVFNKKKKI